MQVLWGNVGNYGVLQVLGVLGYTGGTGWCWGSKKSTVGYCMVLLGTTRYWVVLGCTGGALVGTEGTGGFWGYSVVPEVLWGIVVYSWVLLGSTGYWGCTCGY